VSMTEDAPQPAAVAVSSHHRDTLEKILRHPAGHNIEWRDVLSLLGAVGAVEESHDGKYLLTLGGETETMEPPRDKDIDTQMVVDLRRMLRAAGYGEQVDDEKAEGGPD
jgi:hypothetical protein